MAAANDGGSGDYRRHDDNPDNAASLSLLDKTRTCFYFQITDKLITELQSRFAGELVDFCCLDPHYFGTLDGKQQLRRLASRYQLDPDTAASQWRLSHQFVTADNDSVDMLAIYKLVPQMYTQLKLLYNVLLTLPVTTATVERGFSKLSIVK